MAKKEATTDLWVHDLLKEAGIKLDAQGSTIKEIDDALKSASKRGTGKAGFPEYVGVVKDFVIVIEDKADLKNHIKLDSNNLISMETKDITDYAVNGALFYAKHLAQNTNYKKIFAFGISGSEKKHKITPLFVDDRCNLFELEDVESFISFNSENIDEYYLRDVLKESTDNEKELEEILADAKELHEHLRNYGNMKDEEKPFVVSGILLALRERDNGNFSIDSLVGDNQITDGQKIHNAIISSFQRTDLSPIIKIDKIISQFNVIKDSTKLNEVHSALEKTPLRYFTEFLDKKLYKTIKYSKSTEDYLGRFYGEFMRYSGGSGQSLGIVLTPRHITELFCDLLELKSTDRVFDPCCGTGGFLVAALHTMLSKTNNESEKLNIRKNQLFGIELRPDMFTVATTNMILRGDGKSNLHCDDFLMKNPKQLQTDFRATVGMLNPPYSQGSKQDSSLYEIAFTEHLLDSLLPNSRCAVIVPQSSMTGKTNEEQQIKESILKNHTLEGVIMLQKDTFYGIGVIPCIAVFTSGQPHPKDKICKFINFEDDGFKVSPHVGLLETEAAKDKKQHLLDVWFDRIEAENKFCVKTTVNAQDEWLHSFYYFNDEIPSDADFEKTVGDYLSFEFSMIMQGRRYLFEDVDSENEADKNDVVKKNFKLSEREWKEFRIEDLFEVSRGNAKNLTDIKGDGNIAVISASDKNNGCQKFTNKINNETIFKKVISVNNNGSIGFTYYHPYNFIASSDVSILQKEKCLSENLANFICNQVKIQSDKYHYGYKMSNNRLLNQKILLPVLENGEPDFDFMENYIHEVEQEKLSEYKSYAQKQVSELSYQDIEPLEKKEWKAFLLTDLFLFEKGNQNNMNSLNLGNIPLISAKKINNGYKSFVSVNSKKLFKGNCISLNNDGDGGAGLAYYQPSKMAVDSHVSILYQKEILEKNCLIFLSKCISQQANRFGHGHSINNERLKMFKVVLPITSHGKPDYAYMEQYTKNLMLKKYYEYLDYKFKKSKTDYNFSEPYLLVAEKS